MHIKEYQKCKKGKKNVKRLKKMEIDIQQGKINVDPMIYLPNYQINLYNMTASLYDQQANGK